MKKSILLTALLITILLVAGCYNTIPLPLPPFSTDQEEEKTPDEIKAEDIRESSEDIGLLLNNMKSILDGTLEEPVVSKGSLTPELPVDIAADSTLTMILPEKYQGWHWQIKFLEESNIDALGNLTATLAFSYYKDNTETDDITGPLGDLSDGSSGLYGKDIQIRFNSIPLFGGYDEDNILIGSDETPLSTLKTTDEELYKQAIRAINGNQVYSIRLVFSDHLTVVQDEKVFEELEPWEILIKSHRVSTFTFENNFSLPCTLEIDNPSNGYLGVNLKTSDGLLEFSADFYGDTHYSITKFAYDGNEYTESDALLLDIEGITGKDLLWSISEAMEKFVRHYNP